MNRLDLRATLENRVFYFIPSIIVLTVWASYVILADKLHLLTQHYRLTLTMVFGSLVAGATSEGGGAVAFPVFTKLFSIPPEIARTFSMAIQMMGMGAASIVIFKYRIPVVRRALILSSLGGFAGVILGLFYVAPLLPPSFFKISFTIITLAFGFVLFVENRNMRFPRYADIQYGSTKNGVLLILIGLLGGVFTSIAGSGIDFLTFSVLVLYFNVSEKVATPTSVVLMAVCSATGLFVQHFVLDEFRGATFDYWIACVPVVIFGAPIGALICAKISRESIIRFLLLLIGIEFMTTLLLVEFTLSSALFAASLFLLLVGVFAWLNHLRLKKLEALADE